MEDLARANNIVIKIFETCMVMRNMIINYKAWANVI